MTKEQHQAGPSEVRVPRSSVKGGNDLVFSIVATDRPELTASGKARFIAPTD